MLLNVLLQSFLTRFFLWFYLFWICFSWNIFVQHNLPLQLFKSHQDALEKYKLSIKEFSWLITGTFRNSPICMDIVNFSWHHVFQTECYLYCQLLSILQPPVGWFGLPTCSAVPVQGVLHSNFHILYGLDPVGLCCR